MYTLFIYTYIRVCVFVLYTHVSIYISTHVCICFSVLKNQKSHASNSRLASQHSLYPSHFLYLKTSSPIIRTLLSFTVYLYISSILDYRKISELLTLASLQVRSGFVFFPKKYIRFGSYCTAHISGKSAAHRTTKHFWGIKAVFKKKKTNATGLVIQSRLEESTLAKEFWPLAGPS